MNFSKKNQIPKIGISKMRVVCLSFGFIEYTIQLANALSKTENVMLMLPRNPTNNYLNLIDTNVKIRLFNTPRLRYPTNLLMVYNIIKYINDFKPDVIHLQSGYPWLCFGLPFLKKYALVTTVHDPKSHLGERKLRYYFMNFFTWQYTDKIIVHGEKMKEIMSKENINKSIYVIPHGDLSVFKKFSPKDIAEVKNTILFFGRIVKYKGLEYLIKAEPLITKEIPDAKIIIAGKGEKIKKYERLMENKGSFMIYNQYIPNELVAELFQKANIVVLPYIDASQSGVIPIAYAFKKPVVATDVGCIPEVVDDGKTGYIVPPKNPEKLAEAVIKLLKNPDERERMGENAYNKMLRELSWGKIAKKTIEVYKDTLRSKNINMY